jgi:dihydrofolate synthase / folylpolyglutamate synthase
VLDRLFALETFGMKLGLENISRLCDALGHPERDFISIHVAGTNGKGSVTAMAHAALVSGGIRAARYISPHLVDLNERFVIGSQPVDTAALEAVAAEVVPMAEELKATFFEATTAMAFALFSRAHVDAAVIEVGLGGRFDATNVLSPAVAAITSIGLDHQQHLGNTLEAIAFEKAGIIKPGVTVVLGAMPEAAAAVIRRTAASLGARAIVAADGVRVDTAVSDGRATLTIDTPVDRYGPMTLALRGAHQVGNAVVAVRALECAREAGIVVAGEAVERGLSTVAWPARLEIIAIDDRRVLIDAAHNVEGARALAAYLEQWHRERPPLVISVMRDKDLEGMLAVLLPVTSSIVATEAPTPRAVPAADLARRVLAVDPARAVHTEADPLRAVEWALERARDVCVAGSIFLAGAVRDGLKRPPSQGRGEARRSVLR